MKGIVFEGVKIAMADRVALLAAVPLHLGEQFGQAHARGTGYLVQVARAYIALAPAPPRPCRPG